MRTKRALLPTIVLLLTACITLALAQEKATPSAGVLTAAELQKVMPQSFFYAGQSAPVQLRNSGGFRSAAGKLVLAGLVDSSGYSSGVAEKYQGVLVTEVALTIGGKKLAPGAYGIGTLADGKVVVTDIGANELLTASITEDSTLKRPVPLKFVASGNAYRLYLGRKYVTVEPASK